MLFFGHVFSEKVLLDPKKVEALQNAAPTNASEVRSLLSSAAFCSRFIKDLLSLIARSLRRLTGDGTRWYWTQAEQLSFERLKEALSINITLGYFA